MSSIDNLKNELAALGVDITSRQVKSKIHAAKRQAEKEASIKFKTGQKEQITERIQSMLSVLAVFFVAGFLVAGNIAIVIMFPFAEYTAVRRGIMTFEAHSFIASFNAATLTIGYVVLLFVKYVLRDNKEAGKETIEKLYNSTQYTIIFIQVSIVLFGFLGRTSDTIINGEIGVIQIIGYVGTFVLTIALLAVTDITVLFIYSVFNYNVGELKLAGGNGDLINFLEDRTEALQIEALTDLLIMEKVRQQKDLTE